MKSRLFLWSLISSLAGFLFGFDTVVISGAEQTIQSLWGLSPGMHGLAMAAALYGTVIGAMAGAWPAEKFGRKATLFWIGILYFVSAVWSGFAPDVVSFIIARFIGGLGVGVSTVVAPMYICEIAPPERRGRLAGMFQFNIVFGIVIAFLSNALIARTGENAWRWMLGVEAFPAFIYTVCCIVIPESPRWLIAKKGDHEKGRQILQAIDPSASNEIITTRVDEIARSTSETKAAAGFWTRQLKTPICLALLIAFFNQLSGINAILYFAPRIFEMTGIGQSAALLQSIGVGVTNLVFTFVGLALIDRIGRRTLLFIGCWGYVISLGAVAYGFFSEHYALVPIFVFAFIASHAVGQGAVIWVFLSEIFPNQHRAKGQALGSFTHWVFAALLTTFFPKMVASFHPGMIFLFFCAMMVVQMVWIKWMVPETRGVPLEEIQRRLGVS